jgi:hypothetical protein
MRWNSNLNRTEIYRDGIWTALRPTVTTFTSTGTTTFNVPQGIQFVDVLVVGGGGGGGCDQGGGGGGGGVVYRQGVPVTPAGTVSGKVSVYSPGYI